MSSFDRLVRAFPSPATSRTEVKGVQLPRAIVPNGVFGTKVVLNQFQVNLGIA